MSWPPEETPVTTTETIADFLESWWQRDLPSAVVHEGKRSILNVLGASVGAMGAEPVRVLRRWAQSCGDAPARPVLWTTERLSAERAALLNAAAMHVLDFNDTHIPTHAHAGAPVIAAALSTVGEEAGGADLLRAVILGMEVHFAIATAIMPSHFRKGFHITATGGAIGAAAAGSLMLGLDAPARRHALSTAMLTIAGQREGLATMSNAYGVGNGSRTGVAAAMLAAFGFTSALAAFDGPDGVRHGTSTADAATVAAAMGALGSRWIILENSYKYFPTETISQAVVEGLLRLREGIGDAEAAAVPRIELRTAPLVAEVIANRTKRLSPTATLTRTFDTKFCAAMAWLTAGFGPQSLMPDEAGAAAALALRERIAVAEEPAYRVEQASATVTFPDGRQVSTFVDGYTGSAANPMTDAQLEAKLVRAARATPFEARVGAIIDAVWNLDDGRRAADLTALLHD